MLDSVDLPDSDSDSDKEGNYISKDDFNRLFDKINKLQNRVCELEIQM